MKTKLFKTIYELTIVYLNGEDCNLLFASKKGAIHAQETHCKAGTERANRIVMDTYITERTLFK